MSTMLVDGGKSSGISGQIYDISGYPVSRISWDIPGYPRYPRISWISDDIDDALGFSIFKNL
jgi:hypothetical protein